MSEAQLRFTCQSYKPTRSFFRVLLPTLGFSLGYRLWGFCFKGRMGIEGQAFGTDVLILFVESAENLHADALSC